MGRVRQHTQVNLVSFVILFVQVSQMIFDIARCNVCVRLNLLQELLENSLRWLFKHTMQSVESSSVSHTHYYVFNFIFCSNLDHFSKSRSESIKTLNTKSFEVSKLSDQEINKTLIFAEPFESLDSLFLAGL